MSVNSTCIGQVARVQSGYAFKSDKFTTSGVRLLRNTNILPGRVYWDEIACIDAVEQAIYESYCLNVGDVLLSLDRPVISTGIKVARVTANDLPSLLVQRVGRFVLDKSAIDPDYLHAFLQSPTFIEAVSGHGQSLGVPHISPTQVESVEIPLPTLDKQRQIALAINSQLTEVETARQAAEAQLRDITLLRSRTLKAIFAELDDAPRKTLGDHATTMSGSTPSRGNKAYWQPAEIPWVKTGEVAFAPITATEEAISTKALAECSLALLPPKTILIAMIGQGKTRGQSAMLEIAATTNQNCFAVLPNDTWEPEFLYYWIVSSYQDLRKLSADRGGSQSALNGALLKALQAPAPDKTAQQNIVQRVKAALATIDAMEQACKASLKDIEQLPQRILAQAFSEVTP